MEATRSRGAVYGRQGRTIVILLLILGKTRSLQVKVKLFLLLPLLYLELLVDLVKLFEGDAPRATSRPSCAAKSTG
jgi:hypothetical protein